MRIFEKDQLPPGIKLCPDLIERAEFFIEIKYLGYRYYIPITKKAMKVLKITRRDLNSEFLLNTRMEGFFQDIVASIYLQIRDTIGAEIHRQLSEEIKSGFENLFSNNLEKLISNKFEQKQLPKDAQLHPGN
jgi:hypothetical protein